MPILHIIILPNNALRIIIRASFINQNKKYPTSSNFSWTTRGVYDIVENGGQNAKN